MRAKDHRPGVNDGGDKAARWTQDNGHTAVASLGCNFSELDLYHSILIRLD